MPKYRNTAPHVVVIPASPRTLKIGPGQIVELKKGQASRGAPYLVEVKEETRQVLIEAPLPVAPVVEAKPEPKVEEPKVEEVKTVAVDIDGDGVADVELKGEVIEEKPAPVVSKKSKKKYVPKGEDAS